MHGGASAATTWSGLAELKARWTLAVVNRRGFSPSPRPPAGHQDFEVDAADLVPLLDDRPHLVAHSYGGIGAVMAAISRPSHVRSLALLEPAFFLPRDDPEVARFQRMGDAVISEGLDADQSTLREFLRIAGAPVPDEGPLPPEVVNGVRRAHGSRPPSEADPPLDTLRDAGFPILVASGGHHRAIERSCDALAAALEAQRSVSPGAGHFIAAAPGFAELLEQFLLEAS